MSGDLIFGATAMILVVLGLSGVVAQRHLLRKVVALNMMSAGVFLFLVSTAARGDGVDPVPHAMVLTGVVVSVCATALGLALVRRIHRQTGELHLGEAEPEEEERETEE